MKSNAFMLLGLALLFIGLVYPMATLVVDNTPPIIDGTVPQDLGSYGMLDQIIVRVYDPESGIGSVQCSILNVGTYTLTFTGKTEQSFEIWYYVLPKPITTPGTYSFVITATNKAGLTNLVGGVFNIVYTPLKGKWYINNQEITNATQTVYSPTETVSFKFQRSSVTGAGDIDDSKVSAFVVENGNTILTLSLKDPANHIWTGSYTFTPGTHNLELKASDGTTTITLSVVGLEIPGQFQPAGWKLDVRTLLMIIGALLLAFGILKSSKKTS